MSQTRFAQVPADDLRTLGTAEVALHLLAAIAHHGKVNFQSSVDNSRQAFKEAEEPGVYQLIARLADA